jgi:hypothetical protein
MSEFPQYFGGSTTRRRYPPTPNHNEATEENIDKTLVESSTKPVENSVNPSENYSAYLLSATQIWNAAQV